MDRNIVKTDKAPAAIGPYSQGVTAGGFLYTAMQIPLDPATGEMVGNDAPSQARKCLENTGAIVEAAGGAMENVVKTTVYLTDLAAFGAVNEVYAGFFPQAPPARGVLQAAALPKGALVAVEAICRL